MNKIDYENVSGYDWSHLLRRQPELAVHCNWVKLDGYDWCWLLSKQHQFAEHCDWVKLNGDNWRWLLVTQPRLRDFITEHKDKFLILKEMKRD